ncbi:hypothetical protein JCGZ_08252 [Jatropha curcas]|uniref:F-box domain-containing protein n=1 Tax=Jatropha curcas TaxID=180498 RepID=A0A067KL33_JATCU|nr:putative F-box/LRR-repeat protein At5g02700 isoform X2 [Jatropha curcas]KDP36961.1 hypothetical protein JCGZ_08252 [Jatropha curcas]
MAFRIQLPNFVQAFLAFSGKGNRSITAYGERSAKVDYLNKDYIGELPDDILASIVSYLPVKDAVKTSVLSKRWRHLYLLYRGQSIASDRYIVVYISNLADGVAALKAYKRDQTPVLLLFLGLQTFPTNEIPKMMAMSKDTEGLSFYATTIAPKGTSSFPSVSSVFRNVIGWCILGLVAVALRPCKD